MDKATLHSILSEMQMVYDEIDEAMKGSPLEDNLTTSDYQGVIEAQALQVLSGVKTIQQAVNALNSNKLN